MIELAPGLVVETVAGHKGFTTFIGNRLFIVLYFDKDNLRIVGNDYDWELRYNPKNGVNMKDYSYSLKNIYRPVTGQQLNKWIYGIGTIKDMDIVWSKLPTEFNWDSENSTLVWIDGDRYRKSVEDVTGVVVTVQENESRQLVPTDESVGRVYEWFIRYYNGVEFIKTESQMGINAYIDKESWESATDIEVILIYRHYASDWFTVKGA